MSVWDVVARDVKLPGTVVWGYIRKALEGMGLRVERVSSATLYDPKKGK
jgi:RNAse (barnase) inhibitor barstar